MDLPNRKTPSMVAIKIQRPWREHIRYCNYLSKTTNFFPYILVCFLFNPTSTNFHTFPSFNPFRFSVFSMYAGFGLHVFLKSTSQISHDHLCFSLSTFSLKINGSSRSTNPSTVSGHPLCNPCCSWCFFFVFRLLLQRLNIYQEKWIYQTPSFTR